MRLIVVVLAGMLAGCGGQAISSGSAPMAPLAPTATMAQGDTSCAAFDSRIWAQAVYDDDQLLHLALDPDQNGIACDDLPLGAAPALWTDAVPADAIPVSLASVTDGDTLEVVVHGRLEAVRLVGVDAPEAGGPYRELECFGTDATGFLEWLLGLGGQLSIEKDQEERDRFGRLLRWVWLDLDGEVYLVNEALLRAGYAERFRDTPNRRYVDEMIDAEAFARGHEYGLWNVCDGDAEVVADTSAPVPTIAASDAACDPAYPDVCLPPPPPDLECRDIPYTHIRVLPPDPHHFDGNGDGVGCEGPP